MPGTPICAWCKSPNTQAGFTMVQCLDCGLFTNFDGTRTVASSEQNEGVTVADITEPEVVDNTQPTPTPTPEPEPDPAPAEVAAEPVEQDTTVGEEAGTDTAQES